MFGAIAEELGHLLGVDSMQIVRYEDDRAVIAVAAWGPLADPAADRDARATRGSERHLARLRTGRAARLDDYGRSERADGRARGGRLRAAVGAPIFQETRLWGAVIAASTHDDSLPAETELRIGEFTELMATAIANAESQAHAARLADEQAALRRVATLVAQSAQPAAVFDAVTAEMADILDASAVTLARYDGELLTVLADHGKVSFVRAGEHVPLGETAIVLRTGRPARMDD